MKWLFFFGPLGVLLIIGLLTIGAYLEEKEDCDEDRFLGT